jgi:cyclic pyranopterin phosphate synthase
MAESKPSHLDEAGRARMVDVGGKALSARTARACGDLVAEAATLDRLEQGDLPKGEALATARTAGVLGAKRADELIPLCHSLPLTHVAVDFARAGPTRLRVTASASTTARTGVEMEALTAVTTALLSLYDMAKSVDPGPRFETVQLLEKTKEEAPSS